MCEICYACSITNSSKSNYIGANHIWDFILPSWLYHGLLEKYSSSPWLYLCQHDSWSSWHLWLLIQFMAFNFNQVFFLLSAASNREYCCYFFFIFNIHKRTCCFQNQNLQTKEKSKKIVSIDVRNINSWCLFIYLFCCSSLTVQR